RPRTDRTTFGARRAEVLAAFLNGIALAVTAASIVGEAIERLRAPAPILGGPMLLTAVLGLAVNLGVAALLLRSGGGGVNLRAATAHVLMDAVGSLGAILAAIAVLWLGWLRADAIVSLGIAGLVAWSGLRVLRETTGILLEAAPDGLDVQAIERTIAATPGVASVHDLHVWGITDRFAVLTVHVVVAQGAHGVEVCRAVARAVARDHGIEHVTVQPEAPAPTELVPLRRSAAGEALGGG
ncbi:MAG: cation transporter, partial [Deltaproteobacteria bacterium]|nr:cation transporter [Deltaproteobacteria bacterium]